MPPDHLAQTAFNLLLHGELTGQILGAFYSVYRELGGGFAESVYEAALARELRRLGLKADCLVPITVHYKNRPVGMFRAGSQVLRPSIALTSARYVQVPSYHTPAPNSNTHLRFSIFGTPRLRTPARIPI